MAATRDNPIIFYDLVNADGISWSLNLYKTRMCLNYKGIPYRVEGIMLPDIESRMKELGVSPVSDKPPRYTLPTIADPSIEADGQPTYVTDSFKIALYLDDKYPAPQYPAIFLPGTRSVQHLILTQLFPTIGASIAPLVYPSIFRILDPRSAEHVHRTSGARTNPLPDEVAAQKWEEVRSTYRAQAKSLVLNDETGEAGPFYMGCHVSFLDFAFGGLLHWIKHLEGSDSPRLKQIMEWDDGCWEKLWQHLQEIENKSSQVD